MKRHKSTTFGCAASKAVLIQSFPRSLTSAFDRALDLLFIQAFKSHGSLYSLCVMGHGEDAATIARRIFEIALQVAYLTAVPSECENRAERYLAQFWRWSDDLLRKNLPPDSQWSWSEHYERHKHLLLNSKGKPMKNWWGDSTLADLATQLDLRDAYDDHYKLLSKMAHCSAQGLLVGLNGGVMQITTDAMVTPISVYGTRYALGVAEEWNNHFKLIDEVALQDAKRRALDFDLRNR